MNGSGRLALLVAAIGCTAGCAARVARLTWPMAGAERAPPPPPTAPAVALQRLEDLRPEPRRVVGEFFVGIHLGDLVSPDDPTWWATGALRDALHRAGVRVVPPAEGVPLVGGELHLAYGSEALSEVELRAWMRTGEEVDYNAWALGRGATWNPLAAGEGYAEALDRAMRDACEKVATAVKAALAARREREGGRPGDGAPRAP